MAVLLLIPAGHSMARVAVVGIAVAEPESYGAAVPALEVDIVCAMLVAVLLPSTNDTCTSSPLIAAGAIAGAVELSW